MMLARLLPALALCALAPHALADRFYFGPASTDEKMVEGEPDFVEGVLLAKEDGFYVIRIEGGEIRVPEASVRKVESSDLSVATIEQREADAKAFLAEANTLRQQMFAAAADARREAARAAEAAASRAEPEAAVPVPVPVAVPAAAVYDPVLHVAAPPGASLYLIQKELGGIIRRQIQKDLRAQIEQR